MSHRKADGTFVKKAELLLAAGIILLCAGGPSGAQTKKAAHRRPAIATRHAVVKPKSVPGLLETPAYILMRPAQFTPKEWAKISALRPGMTRGDLLRVFDEEGGPFTRFQQTYLLRKPNPWGQCVKIDATFAGTVSPITWCRKQGYVSLGDYPRLDDDFGSSGDVITSLSPLYWGQEVMN